MGVFSSLSPEQKSAVKDSWEIINNDLKEIGSAFFVK
jgi:hypothetical protein